MVVSPISFATVNYFVSKFENEKIAREKLRKFKIICEICSLDEQTIEKIVVTAQKRTENIQEVPISITAIEPTKIENVGFKQCEV